MSATNDRIDRASLHMLTAMMWASRSTCRRLSVGCVITTSDLRRVLSIGYNGPAKGLSHRRCTGEPGRCGCLHAEDNAIAAVDSTIPNKAVFITAAPCETCSQRIIQAGVSRVMFAEAYRLQEGLEILRACNVHVEQWSPVPALDSLIRSVGSLRSTSRPTE